MLGQGHARAHRSELLGPAPQGRHRHQGAAPSTPLCDLPLSSPSVPPFAYIFPSRFLCLHPRHLRLPPSNDAPSPKPLLVSYRPPLPPSVCGLSPAISLCPSPILTGSSSPPFPSCLFLSLNLLLSSSTPPLPCTPSLSSLLQALPPPLLPSPLPLYSTPSPHPLQHTDSPLNLNRLSPTDTASNATHPPPPPFSPCPLLPLPHPLQHTDSPLLNLNRSPPTDTASNATQPHPPPPPLPRLRNTSHTRTATGPSR